MTALGGTSGRGAADGIVLDVQAVYAGFWKRAWAVVLDAAFDGFVAMVLFGYTDDVFAWPLLAAFLLIHHVGLVGEGGTIGKRVLGLRVVRIDGTRVGVLRAALRELVRLTGSIWSLGLGFLWMLDDRHRQTWHDKAAGTIVVRELRAEPGPPWRYNPPWRMPAFDDAPGAPAAQPVSAGWSSVAPVATVPAVAPTSTAGAQAMGGAQRIDPNAPPASESEHGADERESQGSSRPDPFSGPGDDAGDEGPADAADEGPDADRG